MDTHRGGDHDWKIKLMIISLLSNREEQWEGSCEHVLSFLSPMPVAARHSLRGWWVCTCWFFSRNCGHVSLLLHWDEDVYAIVHVCRCECERESVRKNVCVSLLHWHACAVACHQNQPGGAGSGDEGDGRLLQLVNSLGWSESFNTKRHWQWPECLLCLIQESTHVQSLWNYPCKSSKHTLWLFLYWEFRRLRAGCDIV